MINSLTEREGRQIKKKQHKNSLISRTCTDDSLTLESKEGRII